MFEYFDIAAFATAIGAIISVISTLVALKQYRSKVLRKIDNPFLTPHEIQRATKYYIKPNCTNVDPGYEAELRNAVYVEQDLFEFVENFLKRKVSNKHLLILSDSGMGKTSFLINYYIHNNFLPRSKRHKIHIIFLGMANCDQLILDIPDKANSVIFLDGYDEDVQAIRDYKSRLVELMNKCAEFKRIILTCRTQFFPSDSEIPIKTGVLRFSPSTVGQDRMLEFWKLYLAPMNDKQVKEYISKRFPIWQWRIRKEALELIKKIPLLSVRPMIMSYIPELIINRAGSQIEYSFQLYRDIIDNWLRRESYWLPISGQAMLEFLEELAVDLYTKREQRGAECISIDELSALAQQFNLDIEPWIITSRSLLNRTAEGYYKFAHRSIMEYLYLVKVLKEPKKLEHEKNLNDQMKRFLKEIIKSDKDLDLSKLDLTQIDLSGEQ